MPETQNLDSEALLVSRKDDEKFNDFKKNLLQELKVLKEANNMMRQRNKVICRQKIPPPENRWLKQYLEKRRRDNMNSSISLDMDATFVKSKTCFKQEIAGHNRRLIENYLAKNKYESLMNIYNTRNKTLKESPGLLNGEKKSEKEKDGDSQLDLIQSRLDFDIGKLIKDLSNLTESGLENHTTIRLAKYIGKSCKISFNLDAPQKLSPQKIESESQTDNSLFMNGFYTGEYNQLMEDPKPMREETSTIMKNDGLIEKAPSPLIEHQNSRINEEVKDRSRRDSNVENPHEQQHNNEIKNNNEIAAKCLNSLYDQAIRKIKHGGNKKKSRRNEPDQEELQSPSEIRPQNQSEELNHQIISSSLNALYEAAIQTKKKASRVNPTIPENTNPSISLAQNYLDSLYDSVCVTASKQLNEPKDPEEIKSEESGERWDNIVILENIKLNEIDLYDRLDQVCEGSLRKLEENALWLYFKAKAMNGKIS